MLRGLSGSYVPDPSSVGERVRAFVPSPLPPTPPLIISNDIRSLLDSTLLELGRLDSHSTWLPHPAQFLYSYVRKEAVLSSQIEGTQSSLSDLLLFEIGEAPGSPFDEIREVSNYVRALDVGMKRVQQGDRISNRLIREIHGALLTKGRGSEQRPGEFRTSQNWIGGTRPGNATYVPPPPGEVPACMAALEKFINNQPESTPPLIKAALAHVQFETIHPFLDGNGRLGRLLIPLMLCAEGVLHEPVLYLSLYLKANRSTYYELLQRVRTDGDWESWVEFLLQGARAMATEAVKTSKQLLSLFQSDRKRIAAMGRVGGSALRIHEVLLKHPLLTVAGISKETNLSTPTVHTTLDRLRDAKIVKEVTGKQRNKVFAYARYLKILNEGTDQPFSDEG
jgi:Fic family protein